MRRLIALLLLLAAGLVGLLWQLGGEQERARPSEPSLELLASVPQDAGLEPQALHAPDAQPASEAGAGPARLALEESLLRLALADPEGAPLAARRLVWFLGGVSPEGAAQTDGIVSTDGQGVLRLRLPKRANAWSERWLLLRLEHGIGSLIDLPAELAPGENDLGSLRLAPIPVAAAGRVVDGAGGSVAGATVQLELDGVDPEDARVERWFLAGADGSFDLRGWHAPGSAIRLLASCPGCDPCKPLDTVFGRDDVELLCSQQGSIAGRILHGCAEAPLNLHLVAKARGSDHEPFSSRPKSSGDVVLKELAPGVYDVAVVVDGVAEPLLALPGVAVGYGERVVPAALDPFDARARLREVVVRTENERHVPIPATLFFRSAGDAQTPWFRRSVHGTTRLVTTAAALDLWAIESGFRGAEQLSAAGAVTLTLVEARCQVRLRLRDPALAVLHPLCVDLLPSPGRGPAGADNAGGLFEGSGACLLKLEPGKYTAVVGALRADLTCVDQLTTSGPMRIQDFLGSIEVLRFELDVSDVPEQQEVWVDLDAARIERALAAKR